MPLRGIIHVSLPMDRQDQENLTQLLVMEITKELSLVLVRKFSGVFSLKKQTLRIIFSTKSL